jgi:Transcriptional regulator containing an amidase domain and an AraC-type DNA-binding HTH domain
VRALGRILRDRVGESPMRYYLKVRLQAARNSLFYSDIPIQGIAASCGFSCPEVFSRSFRSHFGVSPRDFRQQFAREQLRRSARSWSPSSAVRRISDGPTALDAIRPGTRERGGTFRWVGTVRDIVPSRPKSSCNSGGEMTRPMNRLPCCPPLS